MSVPLVERLRATLREAMVARDRDLVAALRNTLGAIDNATSGVLRRHGPVPSKRARPVWLPQMFRAVN